jgi:hypothetical protein
MLNKRILAIPAIVGVLVLAGAGLVAASAKAPTYKVCVKLGLVYGANAKGGCPAGTKAVLINSQGPVGPQGAKGATGATGAKGATGAQGPAGTNGNTVLNGADTPASGVGNNGDFYLDTATETLYGPKAGGTWPTTGTSLVGSQGLKGATGATGATGAQGPAGTNGNTVLNGASTPASGVGDNGDFYLDTVTETLYGPKAGGTWPTTGTSLVGPQGSAGATGGTGPTGPTGATGAQGPAGTNGNTVLNGASTPTSGVGNDGDFYLDTATETLYGPKASSTWPTTGTSLVGPQGSAGATGGTGPTGPTGATGAQGPAGTNGNTVLNGASTPTSGVGNNGDFYLDTATETLYGPKASGTWPATGTSLVGPQGPVGANGTNGTNGVAYDCSATAYPGIDLADCSISANLKGATLDGANLTGATLNGDDLDGAYLNDAELTGAYLTGANLDGAYLNDATLYGANLNDANLTFAELTGADLAYATLISANLTVTGLTDANLTDANLTDAVLTDDVLTGVTWSNTICPDGTNSGTGAGATCIGHLTI